MAIKLVRRPIPKSITQIIQREIRILADLGGEARTDRGFGWSPGCSAKTRGRPAECVCYRHLLPAACTPAAASLPSWRRFNLAPPHRPDGHLNIVHAEEVVLTRTHVGLVMEYVKGEGAEGGTGAVCGVGRGLVGGWARAPSSSPLPRHHSPPPFTAYWPPPPLQAATWWAT